MNKIHVSSLIAIAVLMAASIAAHAQPGGTGRGAMAGGDSGGRSASHISGEGLRNSNGPDAVDRDKGRARAEDRAELHAGSRHTKTHSHRRGH